MTSKRFSHQGKRGVPRTYLRRKVLKGIEGPSLENRMSIEGSHSGGNEKNRGPKRLSMGCSGSQRGLKERKRELFAGGGPGNWQRTLFAGGGPGYWQKTPFRWRRPQPLAETPFRWRRPRLLAENPFRWRCSRIRTNMAASRSPCLCPHTPSPCLCAHTPVSMPAP